MSAGLFTSALEDLLRLWSVSRQVNRVGNHNDPTLLEAVQQQLFLYSGV